MKAIRNFSRIIIALLFIFSGFVKAIDPLGSTYKFSDYFEAFGMGYLSPLALFLAVLLSTAELVIGLNLLMGVVMRYTATILLVFMSFFTLLTLIVALTNPVTDCGCFGDALVLTNWQTFWKNIVFMVPTLVIFFNRKRFRPITSLAGEWGMILVFTLSSLLISIYNYRNLPAIDFRPYKIGTHIPSSMEIPEGAPRDIYENIFIYEKQGKRQEFAVENIPYSDTNWKYVDRKTTLIKKGYQPPIHDFSIVTTEGQDITDSVLYQSDYVLLVIAHNLSKANEKALRDINTLAGKVKGKGIEVYGMSATTGNSLQTLNDKYKFNYNFHTTDEITLKTIIRSNPGVVLLKDGVILNKWHYRNLPDAQSLAKNTLSTSIKEIQQAKRSASIRVSLLSLLSLVTVLLLLVRIEKQ